MFRRFPYRQDVRSPQSGVALVVVILVVLIISIFVVVSLRSTHTFQRISASLWGKKKVSEVADIGANLAIQEFRRRFSHQVNPYSADVPPKSFPVTNMQYRPMLDSNFDGVKLVLQQYAGDFAAISDPTCTVSVTGSGTGTNYGAGITERPYCTYQDPAAVYNYTVTLLNRAELLQCFTNGYDSTSCEDTDLNYRTRLISQACIAHHATNDDWNDPSCAPPNSFHYGDVPDGSVFASQPELGYRLVIQSVSTDNAGRSSTVTKELLLFVEQGTDMRLGAQAIALDAMNFMVGGYIDGVKQMVPASFLTDTWWGFQGLGGATYSKYYFLGQRYQYNAFQKDATASPGDVPYMDKNTGAYAGRFNGLTIDSIFSNVGITNELQATSSNVCAFCTPAQANDYSAAFGSLSASPVPIDEGGALDIAAFKTALNVNDQTVFGAVNTSNITPTSAAGSILVSGATPDTLNPAMVVDNNSAVDSVVLKGDITVKGSVVIPGDLVLKDANIKTDGKGTLYALGNIYIMGDVTAQTKPSAASAPNNDLNYLIGKKSGGGYSYSGACTAGGLNCDNLELVAVGNVVVGNITNAYTASMLATEVSSAASQLYLNAPPMDGLRPTDYSANFQPMPLRTSLGGGWNNWSNTMQVGVKKASAVESPAAVGNHVSESVAIGLLPKFAGNIYGTNATNPNHYFWNFFSQKAPQTTGQFTTGFGFVPPMAELPDPTGLGVKGCQLSGFAWCNPPAALNGGFLQNDWGDATSINPAYKAWLTAEGYKNLYFDGTTKNDSPGGVPNTGKAPLTNPDSYRVLEAVGADGTIQRNTVSNTRLIQASVVAVTGFVTGIGGFGPGVGATLPAAPTDPSRKMNFYRPPGGPDVAFPFSLEETDPLVAGPNYYLDRDDALTCPGGGGSNYYDCDQNGLTITNGVRGNTLLFTQGGLYIYKTNQPISVPAGSRMSFVTSSVSK